MVSHLRKLFFTKINRLSFFPLQGGIPPAKASAMPNQRSKDKVKIQVWVTDTEKKELEEIAREKGFPSLTAFLQAIANGAVKTAVKILVALCLPAKLLNPTDWSGDAIATAAGQGCKWFGAGIVMAWNAGSAVLVSL